jgi:hypothetical protein
MFERHKNDREEVLNRWSKYPKRLESIQELVKPP